MHKYFANYHTPIRFDTTESSSGSLYSIPCQDTKVFQMQLLGTELTINPLNSKLNSICHLLQLLGSHPILHISRIRVMLFHIGFMKVLVL